MSIRKTIKEYFSYSASEKRALLLLTIVLFLLYVVPFFLGSAATNHSIVAERQHEIDSLLTLIKYPVGKWPEKQLKQFNPNTVKHAELQSLGFSAFQIKNILKYREKGGIFRKKEDLLAIYGISKEDFAELEAYIQIAPLQPELKKEKTCATKPPHLFYFDPNQISLAGWDSLGVSKKLAARIKNYLASGAYFRKPLDLGKIYGFDSVQLKTLLPYIRIAQTSSNNVPYKKLVKINQADTTELKYLPGIGSVLSNRIVKYRKLLGGYASKEQLAEVYGISKEKYGQFVHFIELDTIPLLKINLNKAGVKELKQHPYISFRTAKDIVRFRNRNNKQLSLQQLYKSHILPETTLEKLKPYLKFED